MIKEKKKLNKQLVRGKNSVGNKDGDDSVSTSAKAFSNPCTTLNESNQDVLDSDPLVAEKENKINRTSTVLYDFLRK